MLKTGILMVLDRAKWLRAAEVIDAFRLMPRALLLGYCWFIYSITHKMLDWYMALPVDERSVEASGMAVGVFTALTGFSTAFFNIYLKSGRRWNGTHGDEK